MEKLPGQMLNTFKTVSSSTIEVLQSVAKHELTMDNKLTPSFISTATVRLQMLQTWMCKDLENLPDELQITSFVPPEPSILGAACKALAKKPAVLAESASERSACSEASFPSGGTGGDAVTVNEVSQATTPDTKVRVARSESGLSSSSRRSKATAGEKLTNVIIQLHSTGGIRSPKLSDATAIASLAHIEELVESCLQADSAETIAKVEASINKSLACAAQIRDGARKAKDSLKSHMDQLGREADNNQKSVKKQKGQQEMNAETGRMKAASNRMKLDASKLPPIYELDVTAFHDDHVKGVKRVDVLGRWDYGLVEDVSKPAKILHAKAMIELVDDNMVTVLLTGFGSKYKKTGKDALAETGRAQNIVMEGEGKEQCQAAFKKMKIGFPAHVSAEEVPKEFKTLLDAFWLYGYSTTMASTKSVPNGFHMLKYLASGSVRVILFPVCELLEFMANDVALEKPTSGFTDNDAEAYIEKQDTQGLLALAKQVPVHTCLQEAGETLYVPSGWFCCEKVHNGVLVYGIRHSFVIKSEEGLKQFEKIIELRQNSGADTTKMAKAADDLFDPAK